MTDVERIVLVHRAQPAPRRRELSERDVHGPWARSLLARLAQADGKVLSAIGTTVITSFATTELERCIELALEVIAEAATATRSPGRRAPERERTRTSLTGGSAPPPSGGLAITFGLGIGAIEEDEQGLWLGAAIDRALHLACRAKPFELVLDRAAMRLARATFLFGRKVPTGAKGLRAYAIDGEQPHREPCRLTARTLRMPPLGGNVERAEARATDLLERSDTAAVLVSGDGEAQAELFERLGEPSRGALHLPGVPLGLEPLGSLRLALVRSFAAGGSLDVPSPLGDIVHGRSIDRTHARNAIDDLLETRAGDRRPFVVIDSLDAVDLASLEVVLAVATMRPLVLVAKRPSSGKIPSALSRLGLVHEIALAPLTQDERRTLAEATLGAGSDGAVIDDLATLGGGTASGVLEVARALVSAGDVIGTAGRFVARRRDRVLVEEGTKAFLAERSTLLPRSAHRLLEVVCVAPDGTPSDQLRSVAVRAGATESELDLAIQELRIDGLLRSREPLRAASPRLRTAIVSALPVARSVALHRFVAAEIVASAPESAFVHATAAYFAAHGGQAPAAARAALAAGGAALRAGFKHAAVRLAAYAVQLDPSHSTRAGAALITGAPAPSAHSYRPSAPGARRSFPAPPPPLGIAPPPRLPAEASAPAPESAPPPGPPRSDEVSIEAAPPSEERPGTIPAPPPSELEEEESVKPAPPIAPAPIVSVPPAAPAIAAGHDEELPTSERVSAAPRRSASVFPAATEDEVLRKTIEALQARDLDALDYHIDLASSLGRDPAAVNRLRAMGQLVRGDVEGALSALAEARTHDSPDRKSTARASLALSLVLVRAGNLPQAIRSALSALGVARSMKDPRGEAAAMHVLSTCYRALGRESDADAIDEASPD